MNRSGGLEMVIPIRLTRNTTKLISLFHPEFTQLIIGQHFRKQAVHNLTPRVFKVVGYHCTHFL
jgi:hypothetical protein